MTKHLPLLLVLAAVLITPLALRPKGRTSAPEGTRSLVIITPHNEAIRYEFGRAFQEHHFSSTGERIQMDFRTPGGTSEIARYVASEYVAGFQHHWTRELDLPWSTAVERAFSNPKVLLGPNPAEDSIEQRARRAFLASNVSCRLDLFFGGGAFDFQSQAAAGNLVDSGFVAAHPELFSATNIPQTVGGEPYWDPEGRWVGVVVSSFGICFNTDSLQRLGVATPPSRWEDLANPRYRRQIALANPTQSSSVNKAIEMLIQQQMQEEVASRAARSGGQASPEDDRAAISAGWSRAMRLLMKIGANARYFTDSATKVSLDVGAGEAAAGMTIDFYGRYQSEAMRRADGSSPLQYVDAKGGSSVGVDPIGLFRGAPNPDLARAFIAFVMSPRGQKLWNWKPGTPEGPQYYALRRLPVLPALYAPEFRLFRSDPDVQPYARAQDFTYHQSWTSPLFRSFAFIFRVMCIDTHDELAEAWRALIEAGFPPEAMATFSDVRHVDYEAAGARIREALGPIRIKEVQLAKELSDQFRAQYSQAAELARAGQ